MKIEESLATGIPARIEAEASEWFLRIRDGDLSESELNAWRRWLEKDPACERAFQEVEALWADLDNLGEFSIPGDEELLADDYQGNEPVSRWLNELQPAGASRQSARAGIGHWLSELRASVLQPFVLWPTAMASVALVAVALLLTPAAPLEKNRLVSYQTAHGQHRSITLEDGTQVDLGAETILTASYDEGDREVNLVRGEAYFNVTKDKTRPFTVQMGNAFVRVVGTAFNIDRDGRGSTVTVLEGHVRVANQRDDLVGVFDAGINTRVAELLAGDQVSVGQSGQLDAVKKVDADSSIAWRDGLLVFIDRPMNDVVEELNRYSKRRIILANTSVGTIPFTGTVDKTRIDEWLNSLGKAYPIDVSVIDGETVLLFDKKN